MIAALDVRTRDQAVIAYRRMVYQQYGLTLFPHQAEWQLASEGWSLLPRGPEPGDTYAIVLQPHPDHPDDPTRAQQVYRKIIPRFGGAAHVLFDLAAFKAGKSFGTAAWLTGFAIIPDAKIYLVGAAYTTSEPEFQYLEEFLLTERGMNLKPEIHHSDAAHGRMKLKIRRGATFEVKSWDRKEDLKGKKATVYVFTEAYQLPGLQCYTSVKQNLRELRGYAVFPTTPDRPWVTIGHDLGHGEDPEWHCTCDVDAAQNPFTYSQADRDRDDPDKGGIMTREKFDISWRGKLGSFVGRVYAYVRGQQQFSPLDTPELFRPELTAGLYALPH